MSIVVVAACSRMTTPTSTRVIATLALWTGCRAEVTAVTYARDCGTIMFAASDLAELK